MPIDKFTNLLETSELFFTPLAFHMKSDPFEGLLPAVTRDMTAAVINEKRQKMLCWIKNKEIQFSSLLDSSIRDAKLRELMSIK